MRIKVAAPRGFEPRTTGLEEQCQTGNMPEFYPSDDVFKLGGILDKFFEWLQGEKRLSADTSQYYVNIVKRLGGWKPASQLKRKERIAMRKWVEFLYQNALIDYNKKIALMDHYRVGGFTKKRGGKPEVPNETILSYINILRTRGYEWLVGYLLGGARLEQVIYMLKHWKPNEKVKHPHERYEPRLYCTESFCRYYVGEQFGKKRVDYIYFIGKPVIPSTIPEYKQLKDRLRKRRLGIRIRAFREFANQRLEDLANKNNIRLDAVNLILSRELSVTGAHYLDTRNWADKLFNKYVAWLRENRFLKQEQRGETGG